MPLAKVHAESGLAQELIAWLGVGRLKKGGSIIFEGEILFVNLRRVDLSQNTLRIDRLSQEKCNPFLPEFQRLFGRSLRGKQDDGNVRLEPPDLRK